MTAQYELGIGILAGGTSQRMGHDKAGLLYDKKSFLDRAIATALRVSPTVYVIGRVAAADGRVGWLIDEHPGLGPLPAIATLLRHAGSDAIVVPCDMPLLTDVHLQWLIDAWSSVRGQGGAVTRGPGGLEPLFSIYESSLLPALDDSVISGDLALKPFIRSREIPAVDIPSSLAPGLANVNTHEEYRLMLKSRP